MKEGEKVKIVILARGDFYDLVESLELEAREDIGKIIDEVCGHARSS